MALLPLGIQLGLNALLYPFTVLGRLLSVSQKILTRTMMIESSLRLQFLLLIIYSPD